MTHTTQAAGAATLSDLMSALAEYRKTSDALMAAQARALGATDMKGVTIPIPAEYADEWAAAFKASNDLRAAHDAALASTATAPSAPTDTEVIEREARLNRAAGIVAAQAGQSHQEFVEWLCNGGFVQMALSHFGRSVGRERIGFKGPGFDEAAAVVDSNTAPGTPYGDWLAGKTPEHQKLSALMGSVSSDAPAAPSAQDSAAPSSPIDMVLHCPQCHMQHIDRPNHWSDKFDAPMGDEAPEDRAAFDEAVRAYEAEWTNPPHRSHKCHGCRHIWRPADVPTNGVQAVKTTGKADSPLVTPSPAVSAEPVASNWHRHHVAVEKAALQMVRNALRTDAETGRSVRAEMLEMLDAATHEIPSPALAQPQPGTGSGKS